MNKSIKDMIVLEFGKNFRQIIMLAVLVLICVVFSILSGGMFTTARNLSNLMLQAAATAIVAIAVVMVLVGGHIDLSIGSFVGFAGSIAAYCMVNAKTSTVMAILITLISGVILGAWQGYWIAYRRIPSFIVTLAGMQMFRGGALLVTGGVTISPMTNAFKYIGQGYIPGLLSTKKGFIDTALWVGIVLCILYVISEFSRVRSRKRYNLEISAGWFMGVKMVVICTGIMGVFTILTLHLGVPIAAVLVGILAALFSFISSNTTFGKHVYATGGNKEAARLSGINIERTTFMIFVVMGVMCSISSIVYTARINAATMAAGQNMEMDAIAAAIIGGTSTMGGEGSILGAIIGALIMTSIDNGMSIMNLSPEVQYIAKGLVLLVAVWLDVSMRKNTR
jgi:D-xylose transport system permease protein